MKFNPLKLKPTTLTTPKNKTLSFTNCLMILYLYEIKPLS